MGIYKIYTNIWGFTIFTISMGSDRSVWGSAARILSIHKNLQIEQNIHHVKFCHESS